MNVWENVLSKIDTKELDRLCILSETEKRIIRSLMEKSNED